MNKSEHTYTLPTGVTTITKSMLGEIKDQDQIKHVIIPQGVTNIEEEVFFGCTSLTSISIPDSVTSIGLAAFQNCTNLSSITIPNSIKKIGALAFKDCTSLASISIPDSVTSIGLAAFQNCTNLTSITIPKHVTVIEPAAFNNCSSLTSITIPNSVTNIAEGAFRKCTNLTSITIPDSVTEIEPAAFNYCSSLTSITIPNGVISIGSWAFEKCISLSCINIPNSVISIGSWAFERCSSLTSITIPTSVTNIREGTFEKCSSLTSITIPNSVTNIREGAFGKCTKLTSITIPDSVIENNAFEHCANLRFVIIPTNLERQDTNYWNSIGINLQQTTLITHDKFSNWHCNKKLSSTYSYHELVILYQLQNDVNFIPSWLELSEIIPNVPIHDLLKNLPEKKTHLTLPKTYTKQRPTKSLEHLSFFNFTPESPQQEQDMDYLKTNNFEAYQDLSRPTTITRQLKKLGINESNAILQWLTLKDVATLLSIKASSELRPIHASKDDLTTINYII